jgi:hypothetical protein
MCTVSWTADHGRYDVFFNRDELNARSAEAPPSFARRDGVAYLAPRDGNHGGTWLLANELGLTVCLLNDYGAAWRPAATLPRFSRGHVVLACATAASRAEALAAIRAQPLAATPAFRLVIFSTEEGPEPLVVRWQGDRLVFETATAAVAPISSSSFATEEVIAQRIGRFASLVRSPSRPEVAELAAFHRQHAVAAGAHSVLMRREDAATRSIIHVAADSRHLRLDYQPVGWATGGPVMLAPERVTLGMRRRAVLAA